MPTFPLQQFTRHGKRVENLLSKSDETDDVLLYEQNFSQMKKKANSRSIGSLGDQIRIPRGWRKKKGNSDGILSTTMELRGQWG